MSDKKPDSSNNAATMTNNKRELKRENRQQQRRPKKIKKKDNQKSFTETREKYNDEQRQETFLKLMAHLSSCTDDDQVPLILNTLLPNPEYFQNVKDMIERDLYSVLNFGNFEFRVFNFGSAVTGLAFQGSDLDYYIHCSALDMPVKNLINDMLQRIRSNSTYKFKFLYRILNARVPLLRVVHTQSNLELDINFSSPRGCYNSQYLKYLLHYDARVFQLAVILKFWGIQANVSGKCPKINHYSLVLLLIFFCQCQSSEQKLLPPIEMFQINMPETNYGPWNYAFNMNMNFFKLNNKTVRQLLLDFFKFYSSFDFKHNIISTFKGRHYDRSLFHNVETVPPEFVRYVYAMQQEYSPINLYTPLCIQDPFELNFNVGTIVTETVLENFVKYTKLAHKIMAENEASPFASVLTKLFSEKVPPEPVVPKAPSQFVQNHIFEPTVNELQMVKYVLLLKELDRVYTSKDIEKYWLESFLDFVSDILEKLFLMDVQSVDRDDSVCKSEWNVLKTLHLKSTTDVWQNRKRMKIVDLATLEHEMKISNSLQKDNRICAVDCVMVLYTIAPPTTEESDNSANKTKLHMYIKGMDVRRGNGIRSFYRNGILIHFRSIIEGYFNIFQSTAQKRLGVTVKDEAKVENEAPADKAENEVDLEETVKEAATQIKAQSENIDSGDESSGSSRN